MRFKKLRILNFLSFGNDEQELSLERRGLTLIEGENRDDDSARSNGAGKSSILHAWVWALFGKTLKEDVDGDEVVNEKHGRNCRVVLTFEDDHGDDYELTRYRLDSLHRNALELRKGGKRLSGTSIRDTQGKINELIAMDFKSFAGILCGQGITKPFSKLTDSEMKAVLDRVIDLDRYGSAAQIAKDKTMTLGNECDKRRTQIEMAEYTVKNAEEAVKRLAEEHASAKRDAATERKDEIKKLEDEIEAHTKALEKLDGAKSELAAYKKKFDDEVLLPAARIDGEIVSLTKSIEKLMGSLVAKGMREYKIKDGVYCDSCGSEINIALVNSHIKTKQEQIDKLRKDKKETWKERADFVAKVKTLEHRVISVSRHDAALNEARERLRMLDERPEASGGSHERFARLLAHAKRSRDEGRRKLKTLKTELSDLERQLGPLAFWSDGFGNKGIKSLMLDSVLPFLNRKVARYSSILTNANMKIWFQTQSKLASGDLRDNFTVGVKIKNGGSKYSKASGGEAVKVDLCVSRAFHALLAARSRSKLNVIFLDEVMDGLDSIAVEHAVNLITEDLAMYESIFVITHREDLKGYFSNQIKVVKEKGVSRIEE